MEDWLFCFTTFHFWVGSLDLNIAALVAAWGTMVSSLGLGSVHTSENASVLCWHFPFGWHCAAAATITLCMNTLQQLHTCRAWSEDSAHLMCFVFCFLFFF